MHGMKDGCRVSLLFLLLLVSAIDVSGLTISQNMTTKVVTDDTFMVACHNNEGLPVTWRNSKGAVLGPKTRPEARQGSYGYSIIFKSPHQLEDTGNYTCSTPKEKRVFELFVTPALRFTDTATNQSAYEGEEFLLKCEVEGGTVSWAAEGGAIIEHTEKFKVIADGLVIRNVSRHDSQTFICKGVQQRTGMVLDRKIHFHVKHKPIHPSHPQRHMRQEVIYGYITGTVNLTCVAIANPPATFEWKVKDKKAKIGKIINESLEVSILQLHIYNKSAFGNYKCIAKNKLGSYEENFTLKEGVKPVSPSNIEMKESATKSAIFEIVGPNRTLEMDLDTLGFSVQFRKIDEEEWQQRDFNITKNNLYTLDNLEPDTEYELQAATRNAAGLSDYLPSSRWKTSGAESARLSMALLYSVGVVVVLNFLASW
ncbi:hypothetical protein Zmor_010085 [Zophobas morio]|uniref:Uncharacterized protein n=3 Tax=Zophobas morio TaxID=2755281 RepID=A0AA38MIK6_9CUCU|nr:hypothetical protein Zmor_010085 [Zophobas morio]